MKKIIITDACITPIILELENAGLADKLTCIDSETFYTDDETAKKADELLPYADWEIVEDMYDVVFDSETESNSKGFSCSFDYCKNYIESYNGSDESYFADYKSGTVSVVNNITGETEYCENVR